MHSRITLPLNLDPKRAQSTQNRLLTNAKHLGNPARRCVGFVHQDHPLMLVIREWDRVVMIRVDRIFHCSKPLELNAS